MKVGIALFAYNRSQHLMKVLEGLKENRKSDMLYIFHDGLKNEKDREEWEKTKDVIAGINWCEKTVISSNTNKGLAKSIVDGINHVFSERDAVIVLEDDCVPAKCFVDFMYQCFEKYEKEKEVFNISGYSWPINLSKEDDSDIYFCGRTSSWGWGTWKDRWDQFEINFELLKKIKNDKKMNKSLYLWGNDLEDILMGNVNGKLNSWGVFWTLKVIEQNGLCINPYQNMIVNIGCDGSGVNCPSTDFFKNSIVLKSDEKDVNVSFPKEIKIYNKCEEAFSGLYGSYTASSKTEGKEKIKVWGSGNYYKRYEKEVNKRYSITAFVDNYKRGYYAGIEVIAPENIITSSNEKIIVMIEDIYTSMKIVRQLVSLGIRPDNIKLGKFLFEKKEFRVGIERNGDWYLQTPMMDVQIKSVAEYYNVMEVINGTYHYGLENGKKDIIIDVGMNIGDSVIYFLKQDNVKKVYGYEPFAKTFERAKNNIEKNVDESKEYEIEQVGISDKDEERVVLYNEQMSSGLSTSKEAGRLNLEYNMNLGITDESDCESTVIRVRDAFEIIGEIIHNHSTDDNIVVKMDCEGEEYAIIDRLDQTKLIQSIDFLMLEWHFKGKDQLIAHFKKNHFSYFCVDKEENLGLIYAWKN